MRECEVMNGPQKGGRAGQVVDRHKVRAQADLVDLLHPLLEGHGATASDSRVESEEWSSSVFPWM